VSDRHLYWVTLVTRNRDGQDRPFRFVFECGLPTVEAVARELCEFGVVSGQRLRLLNDPSGNRVVAGREDYLFGAPMVGTIQPYQHDVLVYPGDGCGEAAR
jgi:hypothetical protein